MKKLALTKKWKILSLKIDYQIEHFGQNNNRKI